MAGRTISTSSVGTVQLGETDNPLTVTATGTIASTNANALETAGTADWVIGNAGTISASGTAGVGIQLNSGFGSAGGTITNEATGRIEGATYAIYSLKASTVSNAGTIVSTGESKGAGVLIGPGTVTNAGPAALISGPRYGVYFYAGAGRVTNTGTIGSPNGFGVFLSMGGEVDNQAGGHLTAGLVGAYVLGTADSSVVNAGSISGRFGVLSTNPASTVTNAGSIQATGKSGQGNSNELTGSGVQMRNGGTIVNAAGGVIDGYWIGAQIGSFNGANANGGAVINAGTILANDPGVSGAAVWFKGDGRIENAATGTIGDGPFGIVTYNTVSVVNAGTIGGNRALLFGGQGRIDNLAGGSIVGTARGIEIAGTTTIANRGVIGGGAFAVLNTVQGSGDRIVTYPGASFLGTVMGDADGAPSPNGVLQLAAGAGTGSVVGFGSQYLGFGRVEVDAGASWSLAGTVGSGQTVALGTGAVLTLADPAAMAGVIAGFDATTGLVLGGVTDATSAVLDDGNVLTVSRAGGAPVVLRFDPLQAFGPGAFGLSAQGAGTALAAPCFAMGTRIATPAGEVAVEALAAGMPVLLARGGVAEVVWVGHRRVECRRHPRPEEVWPVRVAAGAFARGVPGRDLLLSPDHAVFWEGVLIPVRHLVNGRTVRQEAVDAVTYFHVELAAHDVLLAEGLACESYLDTGNRAAFANGGAAMMLHPDFARGRWAASGCAPLVEAGPAVAAARSRLWARAGAMGLRRGSDAGLVVRADGVALAVAASGARREVALPEGVRAVALESRCWVPAEMGGSEDARRLGVAVGRVRLDGEAAPDSCFGAGWHAAEGALRWSDGCGWLHLRGARRLSFELATGGVYWAA